MYQGACSNLKLYKACAGFGTLNTHEVFLLLRLWRKTNIPKGYASNLYLRCILQSVEQPVDAVKVYNYDVGELSNLVVYIGWELK